MDFFEFVKTAKDYKTDEFVNDLATELDYDKDVIQLQLDQWDKGEDANGRVLGFYSYATELITGGRKKQGDRYNVFDTGETRKRLHLLTTEKNKDLIFDFDSDSVNAPKMVEKVGEDLFGLQQKNVDKFTQIAVRKAIQILNNKLKIR